MIKYIYYIFIHQRYGYPGERNFIIVDLLLLHASAIIYYTIAHACTPLFSMATPHPKIMRKVGQTTNNIPQ